MGWLNVLEAHQAQHLELPVNLRFCFEGMEESGSEGLDELIEKEVAEGEWFKGVDCVCIVRCLFPSPSLPLSPFSTHHVSQSDNYWLNTRTPALTYGLRGIAYFAINVSGPGQDLHSGLFGRVVHEPMTDLIKLMSKLVDHNGHILIPGIEEMVLPPDENEMCVDHRLFVCMPQGVWDLGRVYESIFFSKLYTKMDYSIADVAEAAGASV
jgi:Cys-Gly metallodipeptidase DUG1